jgi:hypothetical protein
MAISEPRFSQVLMQVRLWTTQSIPQLIFLPHHVHWQSRANAKEHKENPLPPERINDQGKNEPVDELAVREEVESTTAEN